MTKTLSGILEKLIKSQKIPCTCDSKTGRELISFELAIKDITELYGGEVMSVKDIEKMVKRWFPYPDVCQLEHKLFKKQRVEFSEAIHSQMLMRKKK